MKIYFAIFIFLFSISASDAVSSKNSMPKKHANEEYWQVVLKRAEKIAATLDLNDQKKSEKVSKIVAQQYYSLSEIQDTCSARIKEVKDSGKDKDYKNEYMANLNKEADKKIDRLHEQFLSKLGKELDPEQVNKVKDGMTYNVLEHTYNGYLDMLPNLTDAEKSYILSALTEAREKAMDASSSEKKHAWFGKYKGRINNYLSSEGYDLKKAGDEWQKRLDAQKKN